MSASSYSLPPLKNIIEVSSKSPKLSSSSSSQLEDIFSSWNKSSLDSDYKICSLAINTPILYQDRSFENFYGSPLTNSDNFSSFPFYSCNDNMLNLPVRKHSAVFNSSRSTPHSPPSSPSLSTEAQNSKKNRINFSKSNRKILKDWLFANIDHPFPNETQKINLSMITGLSVEQVSNWFINGRRRLLIIKKDQKSKKYYKL